MCKFGESVKHFKNIVFLIFSGTFWIKGRIIWVKNVQKEGFYPSRAKLEQLALILLENDSFLQFWPYLSTCPSLKSSFPTHTKFKFLD